MIDLNVYDVFAVWEIDSRSEKIYYYDVTEGKRNIRVDKLSLRLGLVPVGIQERDSLLGEGTLGDLREVLEGSSIELLSEGLSCTARGEGSNINTTGGFL